jgi:hypothetical protein
MTDVVHTYCRICLANCSTSAAFVTSLFAPMSPPCRRSVIAATAVARTPISLGLGFKSSNLLTLSSRGCVVYLAQLV